MSHCRCLGWGSSDSESSRIFTRVQPKALPTIRNLFPVKSRLTTPQAEVLSRCVPDSVALSDVHTQPESAQRIADSVSASPLNIQFHRRGTSGIFFQESMRLFSSSIYEEALDASRGRSVPWCDQKWGGERIIAAQQSLLLHRKEKKKQFSQRSIRNFQRANVAP